MVGADPGIGFPSCRTKIDATSTIVRAAIRIVITPSQCESLDATPEEWATFLSKVAVDPDTGCWNWRGSKGGFKRGYGIFSFRGRVVLAHRFSYRVRRGAIPFETPHLDHLCRNPGCANPDHLEPVTNKENALRGVSFSAVNAKKTRCPAGHEFTPENTIIDHGRRRCRLCRRELQRASEARRLRPHRCQECGTPSSTPLCRRCRGAVRAREKAVDKAARAQLRTEQRLKPKTCSVHQCSRVLNSKGRWICKVCQRVKDQRKPKNPNKYKERRAHGLCVTCAKPSDTYRCDACHGRHLTATRIRNANVKRRRRLGLS